MLKDYLLVRTNGSHSERWRICSGQKTMLQGALTVVRVASQLIKVRQVCTEWCLGGSSVNAHEETKSALPRGVRSIVDKLSGRRGSGHPRCRSSLYFYTKTPASKHILVSWHTFEETPPHRKRNKRRNIFQSTNCYTTVQLEGALRLFTFGVIIQRFGRHLLCNFGFHGPSEMKMRKEKVKYEQRPRQKEQNMMEPLSTGLGFLFCPSK